MLYPKSHKRYIVVSFVIALFICWGNNCRQNIDSGVYDRIKAHIDTIKVINTHEHQRIRKEYKDQNFTFYTVLGSSYLKTDLVSAGAPVFKPEFINKANLDELWDMYGRYLDYCRNTSYYGHFLRGFQVLYGYNAPYFTKEGIASLSEQIAANYSDVDEWYAKAFEKAGFELMITDPYWDPFHIELDPRYFVMALNIDPIVISAGERKRLTVDKETATKSLIEDLYFQHSIYKYAKKDGVAINSLDDYLAYAEKLFQNALNKKPVSIKNSLAYFHSINYEDVPFAVAKELFDKSATSTLSDEEKKAIQDFMFHWIIKKSAESDLPIQIHTGYLAGNANTMENSRPTRLNNLFISYPKVKFVLFHGGYPWIGEFASLGKMFPNVYLDLVWLPQISREAAIRGFDEMLDTVPYNKFFWGGDCSLIEEATGSLEFGKEVAAQVLAARVEGGLMTEEVAKDVALKIFRENAIQFFKLKERLNREF